MADSFLFGVLRLIVETERAKELGAAGNFTRAEFDESGWLWLNDRLAIRLADDAFLLAKVKLSSEILARLLAAIFLNSGFGFDVQVAGREVLLKLRNLDELLMLLSENWRGDLLSAFRAVVKRLD